MWLLAVLGCGGDEETTEPTCDGLTTVPFAEVPATEWDPALPAGLDDYAELAGSWTVSTDCPIGVTQLNITTRPEEQISIVETGWDPAASCGCTDDPDEGPDPAHDPIATFPGATVFVAAWDDPGVANSTVEASGALFPDGAPFRLRACGSNDIEPAANSLYDRYTVTVRMTAGVASGAITLVSDSGDTQVCHLTSFTRVAR